MTADLKKERKDLYFPPPDPTFVDVPPMQFLMTDGDAKPGGEAFTAAVGALYSVAYTLKFEQKAGGMDFTVMPLEGLFEGGNDPQALLSEGPKKWRWTLMIRVPAQITADHVTRAKTEALRKKDLPGIGLVRLDELDEGHAAQMMHIGPYDVERPTIEKLHAFIAEHGMEPEGKHHEIYLSDPARTELDHLKTVIRQPVR